MEVILLVKIANLGALGDRVTVKAGYGRNYLIPQAKAVAATADNIEAFESRRAELEKEAAQILSAAEARATAVAGTCRACSTSCACVLCTLPVYRIP